jgi:hypothetical protein
MTAQLFAQPTVYLPDGSAYQGELKGSQLPRFWTSPPRHRVKDPECRTCSQRGYGKLGCGDYASAELLQWAPSCGYELDLWQRWWLTEACGVRPDGRWAAFEVGNICSRQNGKNQLLEVRELGGLYLFGERMIIHTAHEFKAAAEHFRRVRDTISAYDELSKRVKRVMTSHGDEAIELRPTPTLIFGANGARVRRSVSGRLRFLARSRGSGRSFTADCFSGDTRYWTREGLKTLAETAGTYQDVLVNAGPGYGGAWRKAEIRSFGERQLWNVTVRRNKRVKVIQATAGHRWLVRDSRSGKPSREVLTNGLRPGHKLAWQLPKTKIWHSAPSQFGIAHGVVFGDGSRDQWGAKVELWGTKMSLLPYFSQSPQRSIRTPNDVPGVSVRGLPFFFKDRPSLSESVPYLYGWLAGYFAADGNVTADGMAELSSARLEDLEFVQLLAARLGIGTYGVRSSVVSGYADEPVILWKVQFVSSTLRPEFFLKAEHQDRYVVATENRSRNDRLGWTVVSVEETDRVQEVFCAVVPEHQNFVLEDWINVGNCVVYDEAMFLSDEQVGASMPTMSAVANPQMYYTASAGMKDSVQLAMIRRRVLRQDPTVMGAEWSIDAHTDTCPRDEVRGRKANHYVVCDKHDDRDDPRSWAKANPAFGNRISCEHVRKEFASMTPAQFDRERLGIGDYPAEEEAWEVVSETAWEGCAVPDPGGAVRPVAFAVDVNPEMTVATIAAAWERPTPVGIAARSLTREELVSGTIIPQRPVAGAGPRVVLEIPRGCSREGTSWVVQRLAELKREWRPVAICIPKNGPAAALIDAAVREGIDVLVAGSGDEAAAFALMVTGIRDKRVIHMGKAAAPALWSAIASAQTRDIGDGGRGWSRRTSEDDITPITSATLAYWALNKKRRSYDIRKSVA